MTTPSSMEEHGGANSSHEEKSKEEKDNINRCRMVELSFPTTSFNDEISKNGGENVTKEDIDEKLTPTTANHNNKDEELESTKAEIGEVMEENERLKQHLNQAMKDYQILQRKFHEISQQEDSKQSSDNQMLATLPPQASRDDDDDLVSLSLGRSSSLDSKKGNIKSSLKTTNDQVSTRSKSDNDDEEVKERSLDLGLDCKFEASSTRLDHPKIAMPNSSPNHSIDETKDGEVVRNDVSVTNGSSGDDEVVHQPPVKKARVSVRVRCDGPTMNDGCQWRKYGQKIAKGNPCPRAYYRCTVAPSCPVRKQVQRCAEDMSILITTYEGAHNHPLPVSATAMASTTSAAAYMLMSKSSSSSNNLGSHPSTTTTTTPIGSEFHSDRLKFNVLENSKPKPFYLPNSSTLFSPITTPTHPTVTLDLTSSSNLSSTNQLNRATTPNLGQSRYTSTNNLNFNFSDNNSNNNPTLNSWSNGLPSYVTQSYMNKITQDNPLNNIIGSSSNNNAYNNLFQRSNTPHNRPINNESLPETITQAAKALTSDPSFQSILTATLSSFMSGNNNGNNVGDRAIAGEGNKVNSTSSFADTMKWGALHTPFASSTFESTSKETKGLGSSSLLSKASNSEPTRNLMFLSPSSPFPSSNKRKSNSPDQKYTT